MIEVTLKVKNESVIGFLIEGHANFDQEGSDIVCSAVTILAYSTVNTLDLYTDNVKFSDEDDLMQLEVDKTNDQVDVVFTFFETGIQTLLGNYKEYVKLYYREV